MNAEKLAEELNKLINNYYRRKTIRNGEPRYFDKTYITPEPFEDRETLLEIQKMLDELAKSKSLLVWKVKTRGKK